MEPHFISTNINSLFCSRTVAGYILSQCYLRLAPPSFILFRVNYRDAAEDSLLLEIANQKETREEKKHRSGVMQDY